MDEFKRLYQFDNNRLIVKDGKGRTVAHQAAARNKTNILQFILEQNGGSYSCRIDCVTLLSSSFGEFNVTIFAKPLTSTF